MDSTTKKSHVHRDHMKFLLRIEIFYEVRCDRRDKNTDKRSVFFK